MALLDLRGIGCFELCKRTVKAFNANDMTTYASALAYRALFSLFPFLLFLIAMLGMLELEEFFTWLREQVSLVLPPDALELVNPIIDQMQHLAGEWQQVERIVLGGEAQLVELRRPLVQHMAGVLDERLAVAAMRDEKDADHAPDSNRSD